MVIPVCVLRSDRHKKLKTGSFSLVFLEHFVRFGHQYTYI